MHKSHKLYDMKTQLQEKFKARFGEGASLYASPGRVNLIGEHTDYNMGFVMPGAIDKAIYVAVKPNGGKVCRLYSVDYDEAIELDMAGEKPAQQWACYIYGVVKEMEKRGAQVPAFDMAFGGDVPLGAGLSSSAALNITMSAYVAESWTSSPRCSGKKARSSAWIAVRWSINSNRSIRKRPDARWSCSIPG